MTGHLICIGGLPGVGKTTIAKRLSEILTGSVVFDPDDIHLGVLGKNPETDQLSDADITDDSIQETIQRMKERAVSALENNQTVIIGSAFILEAMRKEYEIAAQGQGARFTSLWLDAGVTERVARAEGRLKEQGNPAGVSVDWVRRSSIQGDVNWQRIDASGALDEVVDSVQLAIRSL